MFWINVFAILLSPVIAVLVSLWIERRREKGNRKLWIFGTLFGNRHRPITDENVRALNMIDVAFHDSPEVRRLWHEYYDMLCNEGLNNPNGWEQQQNKNLEMITEMARVVGYKNSISHLDAARVYYPRGLGEQSDTAQQISRELLRVLKASGGVQVIERDAKTGE